MWIQTDWNSDMGGDRGGRGSGPPHENHKLPFVSRRKTGTNLPREAIQPFPPPPLELSGSDRNFIFFLYVAGLAIILSRDNW